jgi:O-antigen/teichoic acid export membrane protein
VPSPSAIARRALPRGDARRAGGLAVAVALGNVTSLLFTIVFARLLGSVDYGVLAAVVSTFLILSVPGTAMQAAFAREIGGAAGRGDTEPLLAALRRWAMPLIAGSVVVSAAAFALREPLGDLIGVDDAWAAAMTVPAAALWLLLSIERGVLQGLGTYRLVGLSIVVEAAGRLLVGLALLGAGLGVAGVIAGHALTLLAATVWLGLVVERGRRPATHLSDRVRFVAVAAAAGAPSIAVGLLTALQNLDVLVVKREAADRAAGVYATASLAAKAVVWVAVGLGLYLLPEATRRIARSERPLGLLVRTAGMTVAAGAAATAIALVAGRPLLELAFGNEFGDGAEILPWLTAAMTFLGVTYLVAQYLLALRRASFLWLLAAATAALPVVITLAGPGLEAISVALLGLYAALLVVLVAGHSRLLRLSSGG